MKNTRAYALEILMHIEKNKSYSNIALNNFLKASDFDNKDRGFITQMVYGVLEKKHYLEHVIGIFSKLPVDKLDPNVLMILKIGVYQIYFMDGVKDFAAVNESVNLTKRYAKSASGFVNGMLRNVVRRKGSIAMPKKEKDLIKYLAVEYSFEPWMIKRWIKSFGEEFAEELVESLSEKPNMYIRINTMKTDIDFVEENLKKAGIETRRIPFLKEALEVKNLKSIQSNEMFQKGLFSIQDLSSMLVANIMAPKPGSTVLDACSAPGGKASHIAEKMNNTGKIIARDIFDHKIKLIENTAKRLGITNIEAQNFNLLKEVDENEYDYILVDAPCSGLGIIRRKPEIKYKNEKDMSSFPKIQFEILSKASLNLKDGGVLIYSTCTIEENENLNVIKRFLAENKNFKLEEITNVNIDPEQQAKGYLKIYPNVHDMDGFFIAKLRKEI